MLGRGGDILRSALAAIGEHGALMQFAMTTMAGEFAALAAQGVKGARQDRFAFETVEEQAGQELLSLEKLGAQGTEKLVHDGSRCKGVGVLYITII